MSGQHLQNEPYVVPKRVEASRKVAFDALMAVETQDAYANLALPPLISRAHLGRRDAAFATELTYGTLRKQRRIDWVVSQNLKRSLADLDAPVRVILRLCAHQILHLRVPDHAAVSEGVELAKHECDRGAEKFVNGVLRSIVDHSVGEWDRRISAIKDNAQRVSVEYSHPEWMVRQFATALAAHGRDPRELTELLEVNNANPWVTLCARPGMILPGDLADIAVQALRCEVRPGDYSEWSVVLSAGDPGRLEPVREGIAAVQDEGSQLVATAFAETPVPDGGSDFAWLDQCAGPGGKAGLLAAFARESGAHLVANEVAAHRARLVENTLRPFSNVDVVVGDGREVSARGQFDRILLDAPCTGLGSLRRRPESRWRRQVSDLESLVQLQAQLIDEALRALRPGGILGYVTCSPVKQETTDQIRRVAKQPGVRVLNAAAAVREVSMSDIELTPVQIGDGNVIQLWPHVHDTDAMFLAILTKE
ncbi:RsmB/NOP family class I SAM-dependent RNA methyltransferase [Gleimia hominis]|uniref:RsmB/NOP family class I SAM-dependent RNA methyltransferase n=1 Tax=Gleimia hominis TaxID=595468 RepID=UPI000C80D726|nr:transcription antitermination factor NusB [Gleimia hominis]WIK65082.1 transcription antitermination factor NusB [Gleimia hominis]